MNMVRIRHIMEIRRQCKAPPLLPPRLKKDGSDSSDRRTIKDILDFSFKIQVLRTNELGAGQFQFLIYEGTANEATWNLVNESDVLDVNNVHTINDVFGIEFFFEQQQMIRVEICEVNHRGELSTIANAIFSVAQAAFGQINVVAGDESNTPIADITVWTTLREKPKPIQLQLELKNISSKFASNNTNVYIELQTPNGSRNIYRSEMMKMSKLTTRPFTIQTSDFDDHSQSFIDILVFTDEERPNNLVGRGEITYDSLKEQTNIMIFNEGYKNGKKSCCEARIVRCSEHSIFSFLDFIRTGTQLRFCFAVDFSEQEVLNQAEQNQFSNDVEFIVRSISESVKTFNKSNTFFSYGFGAKVPPHYRESNNFCLSLDVDPSCQGPSHVFSSFVNAFQNIQPLQAANFAQIIYHISRISQSANKDESAGTYHVLFIITRGIIADLKETVQASIFSSKAPLSIVFVGIGSSQLDELERIGNAGKRLEYQGRKSERDNLSYVNATKTRLETSDPSVAMDLFAEKCLQTIPWQLSTYFTQSGIVPPSSPQSEELPSQFAETGMLESYSNTPKGVRQTRLLGRSLTVDNTPR